MCGCCLGMCLKHLKEAKVLRLLGHPDREVEGLEWFDMVMFWVLNVLCVKEGKG